MKVSSASLPFDILVDTSASSPVALELRRVQGVLIIEVVTRAKMRVCEKHAASTVIINH